jgi:PAS domain S-box-containing protein
MTGQGDVSGHHANEQIIESMTSGVIAVDANGCVITANEAGRKFLGADAGELRPGRPLDELASAEPLVLVFHEVATSRKPISRREMVFHINGGERREIGLSVSLLQGREAFNGAILLFTDLTDWRRIERSAELNRQLAALGELTAGVVHELRNPVSVISGMAELLMRKMEPNDERRATAEAILREAGSIEKSISQFLGFARPYDFDRGWCNPEEIADRVKQFCQRRAQQKGVSLSVTCEGDLPAVHVDGNRVAQALANIMSNGIDAVSAGVGMVHLVVRSAGDQLQFEITDNGPGIQLKPGENLFSPFFTQKEGGTGLGLTIAHRIINAHNGSISYGNRPQGGACFDVRLPVEEENGLPPA